MGVTFFTNFYILRIMFYVCFCLRIDSYFARVYDDDESGSITVCYTSIENVL